MYLPESSEYFFFFFNQFGMQCRSSNRWRSPFFNMQKIIKKTIQPFLIPFHKYQLTGWSGNGTLLSIHHNNGFHITKWKSFPVTLTGNSSFTLKYSEVAAVQRWFPSPWAACWCCNKCGNYRHKTIPSPSFWLQDVQSHESCHLREKHYLAAY